MTTQLKIFMRTNADIVRKFVEIQVYKNEMEHQQIQIKISKYLLTSMNKINSNSFLNIYIKEIFFN